MTDDEMNRKFEFLLEQQAQFDARMSAQQERTNAGLEALTQLVSDVVTEMRDGFNSLIMANDATRDLARKTSADLGGVVEQMRDGFNNLIAANEATRDLARKTSADLGGVVEEMRDGFNNLI